MGIDNLKTGGDGGGSKESAASELAFAYKFIAKYRKHIPSNVQSILINGDASSVFARVEGIVSGGYSEEDALDISAFAVRASTVQLVSGAYQTAMLRYQELQAIYLKQIESFERKKMAEYVLSAHTRFDFDNSNSVHLLGLEQVKRHLSQPANFTLDGWIARVEIAEKLIDKILEDARMLGDKISTHRKVLDDTKRLTFQRIALIGLVLGALSVGMAATKLWWDYQDRQQRKGATGMVTPRISSGLKSANGNPALLRWH